MSRKHGTKRQRAARVPEEMALHRRHVITTGWNIVGACLAAAVTFGAGNCYNQRYGKKVPPIIIDSTIVHVVEDTISRAYLRELVHLELKRDSTMRKGLPMERPTRPAPTDQRSSIDAYSSRLIEELVRLDISLDPSMTVAVDSGNRQGPGISGWVTRVGPGGHIITWRDTTGQVVCKRQLELRPAESVDLKCDIASGVTSVKPSGM